MEPLYKHGDLLLGWKCFGQINRNEVVVCRHPFTGNLLLKRVAKIKPDQFYVTGDNTQASTDSRDFGWLPMDKIVAKILFKVA